LERQTVKEAFH